MSKELEALENIKDILISYNFAFDKYTADNFNSLEQALQGYKELKNKVKRYLEINEDNGTVKEMYDLVDELKEMVGAKGDW